MTYVKFVPEKGGRDAVLVMIPEEKIVSLLEDNKITIPANPQ